MFKIIVCIKQVPGTNKVTLDAETKALKREGTESIINPYDMYALEEAIRIREAHKGTVTVLTMGPPQAEDALREALSLGVDDAILLSDRAFAGSDTLATSYALAKAIAKIGKFDIIICGKQTMDGDTGQVGPELAEMMDVPCITYVTKIDRLTTKRIEATRLVEEGYEKVGTCLPVVLTAVKELNTPRLPALKAMIKADTAKIPVWTAADIGADTSKLGLDGSPTKVIKVFVPQREIETRRISGKPREQATELVGILKDYNI